MSSSKPKRPGAKHHDSFFRKLHRHHDERRHAGENRHNHEDQEPLLREEHPNASSEVETSPVQQQSDRTNIDLYHDTLARAGNTARDALVTTAHHISRTTKNASSTITNGMSSLGNGVKRRVSRARRTIKRHPKDFLIIVCGILLVLSIGEAIAIYNQHTLPQTDTALCLSPACVNAASGILNNLHPSFALMNPCDDFEQYVCGGFRMQHELRDDQSSIFTGTLVEDELHSTLRHILETDTAEFPKPDRAIHRKVKDAYDACIDEEKIKSYGVKPLKGMIDEIRNDFIPDRNALRKSATYHIISSPAVIAPDSITAPLTRMAKLGINAFVSLDIEADSRQPELQSIFVSPTMHIGLPARENYQNKDTVAKYSRAVESVIDHIYNSPGNTSAWSARNGLRTTVKDLTRGIIQLETRLSTILPNDFDMQDTSKFKHVSLDDFGKIFPQLAIHKMIHDLGPQGYNGSTVVLRSPEYIHGLSKLVAATPADTIQAFLVWKVIQAYAYATEDDVLKPWKEFSSIFTGSGPHARLDRWKKCVKNVNSDFGWILSKFYITQKFSDQDRVLADNVVTNMTSAFGQLISTSEWMVEDDQIRALRKLARMNGRIGFPTKNPDVRDPTALEAYYSRVLVQNSTYFENTVQSARAEVMHAWSKLGQPTDGNEWSMTPTTVDAYYNPTANEIVVPAAIIRKPMFYEPDIPSSLTYGAFGALAGHEITHAFDQLGSQYDENGSFTPWWSNVTRFAFEVRSKCFIEQYSKYSVNGPNGPIHINGSFTLSEAIADAGGVHGAYTAWDRQRNKTTSGLLPGLTMFNQKQLFWLSYGNWWCSKATPQSLAQTILVDSHLPESIRVKGTVMNSRAVREAFNCPVKEPTCTLW